MVTAPKPPLVTRGQETASQTQNTEFFEQDKPVGVTLRVDWNQSTFKPDDGPQEGRYRTFESATGEIVERGEYNTFDARFPGLVEHANPFMDRRRQRAVMVERSENLRQLVILHVSVAMGVSPGDWIDLPRGNNGYGQAVLGPFGARVDYSPLGSDRLDFNVTLAGVACGQITPEYMVRFLRFQCERGAKFTRLDIVMDDHDRVKSPAQIEKYMQGSQVVTRTEKYMKVHTGSVRSKEITGATLYVGAPSSRVRMRVYDKGLESDGEIDAIRWELQNRAEAAEQLGPRLAGLVYKSGGWLRYQGPREKGSDGLGGIKVEPSWEKVEVDWGQVITQQFVSFIDFRKTDKAEVEDRTRLKWYSGLVKAAERVNMYAAKVPRTLEDMAAWIEKSVAGTLSAVFESTGRSYKELKKLLDIGRQQMKPRHKEAVVNFVFAGGGNRRFAFQGT